MASGSANDEWRVDFDAEVEFSNGGALQAQGFRLDIPGEGISEAELGELFVRHLGLLMVGKVAISRMELLNEPHKGSRGVARAGAARHVVDLTGSDGARLAGTAPPDLALLVDLPGQLVRLTDSVLDTVDVETLAPFDVDGHAVLLHAGRPMRVTKRAAAWLADQGAALVGADLADMGSAAAVLDRAGVPSLSGLHDLDRLPPSGFRLHAVPLSAGTPVRARVYGVVDGQ